MTVGKTVLAIVFAVLVAFLVHFLLPGVVWGWLFKTQQGAIGLGLITGIFSSLVAAWLFGIRQKEIWRPLVEEQKRLRLDHDILLQGIAPAIGGPFTQSLFGFHPMASQKIAHILSEETNRQYGRHHSRVIVQTASDRYTIKRLKKIDSSVVWELDLHMRWQWLNDSKITKYPLDDFILVAAANDAAIESFLPEGISETVRNERYKHRAEFLDRNNVKIIIPNPADPYLRVPSELVSDVFSIDRVYVDTTEILKERLEPIPIGDLPIGIYAAWSLPKSNQTLNPPLQINAQLTVEYFARLCLAASIDSDGTYVGELSFPPSDVISDEYKLALAFPQSLQFEGKTLTIEAVEESSGCRFVHGPLENKPSVRNEPKGIRCAEILVRKPLTDLNQISLIWKGELQRASVRVVAS
jgi:hypothetical protein